MTANLPAPRGMAVYAAITDAGRELLANPDKEPTR